MTAARGTGVKELRYHISLYVIIPLVYAGYAVLCAILNYRLTLYCTKHSLPPGEPVFWAVSGYAVFGSILGWLIIWSVLKPIRRFMADAGAIVASAGEEIEAPTPARHNEWDPFFQRITSALSMRDAKSLFPDIIAESEVMRNVLGRIMKVAPTDSTVLITGETGTGKEMIATAIYEQSRRKGKPFIKMNCAAITETLLESELFGHEKGAFTGADARKIGKFEQAHGGTLFLDEIGDMPLETQTKILRVIQEQELQRVGGTRNIKVDVRFIAATHRDLNDWSARGKFREDLYFRLNVFAVELPPLRERKEDIPALARLFARYTARGEVKISSLALQALSSLEWKGNVRELKNTLESAAVEAGDGEIGVGHLPAALLAENSMGVALAMADMKNEEAEEGQRLSLKEQLDRIEIYIIENALRQGMGIQKTAARILGINERALWHRIKKFGIDVKKIKEESRGGDT